MGLLQRSCEACVRARRRCNLAAPCCERCSAKQILCRYTNEVPSAPTKNTSRAITKLRMLHKERDCKSLLRLVVEGSLDTRLQTFVRQVLHDGFYQGSRPPLPTSTFPCSQSLNATSIALGNGMQVFDPLHLEIIRVFDQATLQQLSTILRMFPGQFAQHGATPFIHASLYDPDLPLPLKEVRDFCYSYNVGGKYLASNRLNALRRLIRCLLRRSKRTSTFADTVIYAQAITLAQIIRLLDCHEIEADDAERDNEEMWALTHQLWRHAPIQLSRTLSPWKAWLFSENVRRTIMVCNILLGVYSSLRRGYAMHALCVEALPFDARTKLWEVDNEAAWTAAAAKTVKSDLVTLRQFTNLERPMDNDTQFETLVLLWFGR